MFFFTFTLPFLEITNLDFLFIYQVQLWNPNKIKQSYGSNLGHCRNNHTSLMRRCIREKQFPRWHFLKIESLSWSKYIDSTYISKILLLRKAPDPTIARVINPCKNTDTTKTMQAMMYCSKETCRCDVTEKLLGLYTFFSTIIWIELLVRFHN